MQSRGGVAPAKTGVSRVALGQESEEDVVVVGSGSDLGILRAFALGAAFALDLPLPLVKPPPHARLFREYEKFRGVEGGNLSGHERELKPFCGREWQTPLRLENEGSAWGSISFCLPQALPTTEKGEELPSHPEAGKDEGSPTTPRMPPVLGHGRGGKQLGNCGIELSRPKKACVLPPPFPPTSPTGEPDGPPRDNRGGLYPIPFGPRLEAAEKNGLL